MTDYIVNIGTKFDSSGAASFYQSQQKVTSATKQASTAVKEENAALNSNASASRSAAAASNQYTMSQKAQAAAMRGVPAQITDIVTSLQGGQRPLTVLLQQGGQLKDMFGGIVPAGKALATSIMGLINPTTLAIAAIAGLGYVVYKMGEDGRKLNENSKEIAAGLISLSNASNITEGELKRFIQTASELEGVKAGKLSEVFKELDVSLLGTNEYTANIAANILKMNDGLEGSGNTLANQINAAMKDLGGAADNLYLVQGLITEEQRDQVKAALEQNDAVRAREIILQALSKYTDDQVVSQKSIKDLEDERVQKLQEISRLINAGNEGALSMVPILRQQLQLIEDQLLTRRKLLIEQGVNIAAAAEARAKEADDRVAKNRLQVEARYGTLSQQRAATIALAQENYRKQLEGETSARRRREIEATMAIEIKGINATYDQRDKRASSSANREAESIRKRLEREAKQLKERQEKYLASIQDNIAQSQSSQSLVVHSTVLVDQTSSVEASKQRLALLEAEAKAYEKAGFTMNGYVAAGDGQLQASIELTKRKALELGVIKDINDEIDSSNAIVQQATVAARALADEEMRRVELEKNLYNSQYVQQFVENLTMQKMELEQIRQLQAEGIVPGTREWENAMVGVNAKLMEAQMLAKGIDPSKVKELIADWKTFQEELGKDNEAKQNLAKIQSMFGSLFDNVWERGADGFRAWLADMAKQLARSAFLKMITNLFSNSGNTFMQAIGSIFGSMQADGGAWNNGTQFFANGGVVNRSTPFGMANGKLGVAGEAGPEAILPLSRGSNGKLGVVASGSGGSMTNITISPGAVIVNASDDSAEDAEKTAAAIRQLISVEVRKTVADMQRSGNSLNPAFGQKY